MVTFKRTLFWTLASAGVLLLLLGLTLMFRLAYLSGSPGIGDLLQVPVVLAEIVLRALVKETWASLGILLLIASTFAICLLAMKYLAHTPWERSSAKYFVLAGVTGAAVGTGSVVVGVLSRLGSL